MTLQAIKYSRGKLEILDQLRLPHQEVYLDIKTPQDAWHAIKSMQVRGAPAIAIVAALSIAVRSAQWLHGQGEMIAATARDSAVLINGQLDYLVTSRPTAVNLADAAAKLKAVVSTAANKSDADSRAVMAAYLLAAERMLVDDVQDNERIGKHGAAWVLRNTTPNASNPMVSVMTHCNTGYGSGLCRSYWFSSERIFLVHWLPQATVLHWVSFVVCIPPILFVTSTIQKQDPTIKVPDSRDMNSSTMDCLQHSLPIPWLQRS